MKSTRAFLSSVIIVMIVGIFCGLIPSGAAKNVFAQGDAPRSIPAAPQRARRRPAENPSRQVNRSADVQKTRLVLLIVVDQFRYDYLTRFGDLFGTGGFRRLLRDGASWSNANYDHVPTYTAPGHATMMTGAWPAEDGIIGNDWYDRETNQNVTSVSDNATKLLGGKEGDKGSSPRRLMASTVGDELRLSTNDRAKVVGISIKDRAAILPAGRHADAAYWFNAQTGNMVSSDYYFKTLPAWVAAYNASRPADRYFTQRWERLLPESEYLKRAGVDAPSWETNTARMTNSFPHTFGGGGATAPDSAFYDALDATPFSNDMLLAFAEQAIIAERLGANAQTDVLTVSFSANDYVGHRYGPYSQEVMDITLRTDKQIAALLDFVDARIGLRNTIVAFTADHGVAPPPEQAAALGLGGRRIPIADLLAAVRAGINARYNRKNGKTEPGDEYVLKFTNGNLYLNTAAIARDGADRAEIERIAGEAAMTVPGIKRYLTRTQLENGMIAAGDALGRRIQHGFYSRRSGDVIFVYEPFDYLGEGSVTATHGSPYSYDTHVPLILMGADVRAGNYLDAATPADLAPTLAQLLRIQPPSNAVGRVLIEALRGQR